MRTVPIGIFRANSFTGVGICTDEFIVTGSGICRNTSGWVTNTQIITSPLVNKPILRSITKRGVVEVDASVNNADQHTFPQRTEVGWVCSTIPYAVCANPCGTGIGIGLFQCHRQDLADARHLGQLLRFLIRHFNRNTVENDIVNMLDVDASAQSALNGCHHAIALLGKQFKVTLALRTADIQLSRIFARCHQRWILKEDDITV